MKTLTEIRETIAHTEVDDSGLSILEICDEIVKNLQRIETKLDNTARVARDASFGPAKIGCE